MSCPRPRQSVATRTLMSPSRKLVSAWMRSSWVLSECIPKASIRCSLSLHVRSSTPALVLQKIRHLLLLPRFSHLARMIASRTLSNLSEPAVRWRTLWFTDLHAANASPPILMNTGSMPSLAVQYSFARLCTSFGQVAENISICRSGRIWLKIRRTCLSKPRFSISSASSSTTYVTRLRFVQPSLSNWMKRPGVATTMSTFCIRAFPCSLTGAPP
mmetsp:Transcript_19511/g.58377  ORF Transcript_19511/g.58377 Transcript_19511/m.58377 type:complete len:215 (-) Transcript_19511:289-933(-)